MARVRRRHPEMDSSSFNRKKYNILVDDDDDRFERN